MRYEITSFLRASRPGGQEPLCLSRLKGSCSLRIFSQGHPLRGQQLPQVSGGEASVCPQDPHRFLCHLSRREFHPVETPARSSQRTSKAPGAFSRAGVPLERHRRLRKGLRLWSQRCWPPLTASAVCSPRGLAEPPPSLNLIFVFCDVG